MRGGGGRCGAAAQNQQKDVQASTQYVEAALERRDITNTFSGSGTISAANTYTVKSLVKGTVLTADFEVGDTIEKGTVLYTIDSSDVATSVEKAQLALEQAQRSYDDAADAQYIRSVIGGTVASIKIKTGDYVNAGQEIATVRDDSSLQLTLEFPAADASGFAVGQAAQVMLNGTFETLSGTVQAVAGTDTISSRPSQPPPAAPCPLSVSKRALPLRRTRPLCSFPAPS